MNQKRSYCWRTHIQANGVITATEDTAVSGPVTKQRQKATEDSNKTTRQRGNSKNPSMPAKTCYHCFGLLVCSVCRGTASKSGWFFVEVGREQAGWLVARDCGGKSQLCFLAGEGRGFLSALFNYLRLDFLTVR